MDKIQNQLYIKVEKAADENLEIYWMKQKEDKQSVSAFDWIRILGANGMNDVINRVYTKQIKLNSKEIIDNQLMELVQEDVLEFVGCSLDEQWSFRSIMTVKEDICKYVQVKCYVTYNGSAITKNTLQIHLSANDTGVPRWMVPAMFYKHNRVDNCTRLYPKYESNKLDIEKLISSKWSFRADRCSVPGVFSWSDNLTFAIATEETFSKGLTGVGFGTEDDEIFLRLHFPYTEEPVVFYGDPVAKEADIPGMEIHPNEEITLNFSLFISERDLHAYDPFVRSLYRGSVQNNPLNPWVDTREAADLTAYGLYHWHYKPEHEALYETIAFDRGIPNIDRPHMHVGWVSGVPYAYALMKYGNEEQNEEYWDAGVKVINKIASGLTPIGIFWAEWTLEKGWGTGWNPNKNWIHARTISEAALFMIRAYSEERKHNREHPNWKKAILSNLDYVCSIQREDGHFGSYYNIDNGNVDVWDGAGGILWISALVEAYEAFGDVKYLQAAIKAGEAYSSYVEDEYIYGAPEDVHLTPTSEDGYNAIMAYMALYRINQEKRGRWLELAKKAADWTMTYRWIYNVAFPKYTFLQQYDFKTRGADNASPANNHLHNYGLICTPELLDLWKATGDDYYFDRTKDHIACFLQFIARNDGDINGYKGMVTERYYQTNCFQPKGMFLGLSHSWCVGLILYAAEVIKERDISLNLFTNNKQSIKEKEISHVN